MSAAFYLGANVFGKSLHLNLDVLRIVAQRNRNELGDSDIGVLPEGVNDGGLITHRKRRRRDFCATTSTDRGVETDKAESLTEPMRYGITTP